MTLRQNNTVVVNTDRSFVLGTATPGTPVTGMIRWGTANSRFEVYNGTAWVAILTVATGTSPAWGWGDGSRGQLGDSTTVNKSSPVSVVGGFTDWVQTSAGKYHTVAIRANGTAWAWGSTGNGQLGDNTTGVLRSSPVSVVGGFTNWVQISAGEFHTVAIRANGTAWSWGFSQNGRLGDNTTVDKSSPVSVVGGFTDWVQISAGRNFTLAIRANGTAWSWGRNDNGQLGNAGVADVSSPVSVVGGFTDWVQVSAGGVNHTAAIRANGTAWCWGGNTYGRLGCIELGGTSSPRSVVGGFTDWVQISASTLSTVAVRANGTAWAWGRNNFGQLGDNTITNQSSPVSVVGGFSDWVQITASSYSSAGLRANGNIWTWGRNNFGQLGIGTITNQSSPVSVVGGFSDWVSISGGCFGNHITARRAV